MAKISAKHKEIEELSRTFGFRDEDEFVNHAVKEKVLQLKSLLFSRTVARVARGLRRKGITLEETLQDFERFRHL